ncbi:hypothetical protein BGX28_001164 [Mortierella sp. GBA30]|nr:hypothetical protein BGX28_001164 [Mortierella sp. GBA30]
MTDINSIIRIPELHALLCTHLNTQECARCVRVSRRWRELFTPHLWSELHHVYEERFIKKHFQQKVRHYRHLVRSFATRSDKVLDAFFAIFEDEDYEKIGNKPRRKKRLPEHDALEETQLRKLDLHWSGPDLTNRREEDDFDMREDWSGDGDWGDYTWDFTALCLVDKSPHLIDLSFDLASFNYSEFPHCFKPLKSLQRLEIGGFREATIFSESFLEFIEVLPDQIKELTINVDVFFDKNKQPDSAPSFESKELRTRELKKLSVNGRVLQIPGAVLSRFLKECAGLKELSLISNMDWVDLPAVARVFRESCHELDRLKIDSTVLHTIKDEGIAMLISMFDTVPSSTISTANSSSMKSSSDESAIQHVSQGTQRTARWKSIVMDAYLFGPLSSSALVAHAATLETVHLNRGRLVGKDLQTLLSSSPKLKSLISISSSRGNRNRNTCLPPTAASEHPWICTSTLEELKIAVETERWKKEACDAFMEQLGAMTKLKVLHLQNGTASRGTFRSFSLAGGGLQKLKDLKHLQKVTLEDFTLQTTREDKAWMKEHWPNAT